MSHRSVWNLGLPALLRVRFEIGVDLLFFFSAFYGELEFFTLQHSVWKELVSVQRHLKVARRTYTGKLELDCDPNLRSTDLMTYFVELSQFSRGVESS